MIVSAHLRAPVVAKLGRCRLISRMGTGVDKIDIEEATRRGILVTNIPDFCTEEVADHTLALLLSAARRLKTFDLEMHRGELVVERDLVEALRNGLIRLAALDVFGEVNVFAPGNFPVDGPLFKLDNVMMTPHVAALSEESLADVRVRGAQAVVDVLSGRWPAYPVNPEVVPRFPLRREA
ncbi:MAG: hypothetical protein HQ559_11875 [Lentisphaerae bacterium]|nr:hypothetical protein [Lentisphaerota bacterium]